MHKKNSIKFLKFTFSLLLSFLLCSSNIFGQVEYANTKVNADCNTAILLNIFKKTSLTRTEAPLNYGEIQEITAKSSSGTAFEREHNSSWYLLNISASGLLTFDIIPINKTNDYDFLLFPFNDSFICNDILNKIKPIRVNLSRNDTNNAGVTGLAANAKKNFTEKGFGTQFCKPLFVENKEKYMLVLDNVYKGGKGHTINFKIERKVTVKGNVTDENDIPIIAEIDLTNGNGDKILSTKTNSQGYYSFETSFNEISRYTLNYRSPSKLIAIHTLNTHVLKARDTLLILNMHLNAISLYSYLPILDWYFYSDDYILKPESSYALLQLLLWMQENPNIKIQIEGNTTSPAGNSIYNYIIKSPDAWRLEWSKKKALNVYRYLIGNGIDSNRMTTVGNAQLKKMFPNPQNEYEHRMNGRIEVKITCIK